MPSFIIRFSVLACALGITALASAQWADKKLISPGGESTVATDNKGDVYITCHIPARLFSSHDWGESFTQTKEFDDAMCDMDVLAWPDGKVNVSYIKNGIVGFGSWYSADNAQNLNEGSAPSGSLDREWLAPNLTNGELYMDYSNGFIGGPKSTGVYLAASTDQGKTFQIRSRVDNEPDADGAVDPYLTSSSDGRIYAMWSTSKDMVQKGDLATIDRFDFAYSTDGGKTFDGHQNIGTLDKTLGDTQERWVLGCFSAYGPKDVLAIYPNYVKVMADGKEYHPMLLFYRVSTDGGQTFSAPKTVSSHQEILANIHSFAEHEASSKNVGYYVQTLPWTCVDPSGHFYIAYEDNRAGQTLTPVKSYVGKWQVREAELDSIDGAFGPSERVSSDVVCYRPPLDFLSCAADNRYLYITWTEHPDTGEAWEFTGNTYLGRKAIGG